MTKGKIKYDALGFGNVEDNVFIDMELLRIGKCKQEGETIIATRHINEGADPPTFPVSLRSRHRRLFNEINSELAVIQREQKDLLEKVED